MATLRNRNGTYFIDFRINGRRFRQKVGKSKKIAELALKDFEVKIARNELGFEQKDSDLNKLFDEFSGYSRTNHSPGTQKRYKAILDHFAKFLSNSAYITKISHLNMKTFEDYKAFRKAAGAANKTINVELGCLKAVFYLAAKWGYSKENPVKGIKMLKENNHATPRFLSQEECKKLLDNCGKELYPIFYTFLSTGMRKSELEHLEWKDIDFNRRKIQVRSKEGWNPKTSEREIPINNGLYDLLLKHKKDTEKGRLVFHDGDGDPIEPNKLRKLLIKITKKSGFPDVTKLHSLRHTFASHLVMSGVDLPTVKKLMGHADIETTMIYSHLADEHVEKAVEKLIFR